MNKQLANALKTVEAAKKALPEGTSLKKYQLMQYLQDNGPSSISIICDTIIIQKPNIVPMVDSLVKAGYVQRIRDTTDRRVVNVLLTNEGQVFMAGLNGAIDEALQGRRYER